jgi:hypothetical protein
MSLTYLVTVVTFITKVECGKKKPKVKRFGKTGNLEAPQSATPSFLSRPLGTPGWFEGNCKEATSEGARS